MDAAKVQFSLMRGSHAHSRAMSRALVALRGSRTAHSAPSRKIVLSHPS